MIERTIEQAEDGSYYATNAVTLVYENREESFKQYFFINPDSLYSQVHDYLVTLSGSKIVETDDIEQNKLKKRMTALIRACIKGGLILWGYDLLTLLYGTKEHSKPGKKEDIVDWYMNEFTKITIAYMMKSDIIMQGITTSDNGDKITVQIDRCTTQPVTQSTQPEHASTIE
jgi:hypothetical protein